MNKKWARLIVALILLLSFLFALGMVIFLNANPYGLAPIVGGAFMILMNVRDWGHSVGSKWSGKPMRTLMCLAGAALVVVGVTDALGINTVLGSGAADVGVAD